jgi:hypothetical protein
MARATQREGRALTSKSSGARIAVSGTKIPPSGNRLGCNIAARGYGKNVREKVLPEPETERQKTAAALGDPKSSLRYLNLEKTCPRQQKVATAKHLADQEGKVAPGALVEK